MRRVLFADDHPVFRRGLISLVEGVVGPLEVTEASDADAVLRALDAGRFELVLLDLGMPGADPIEMVEKIRQRAPRVPLLVVTALEEGELAVRLLRAGVDGYVNKGRAPEHLQAAVRRVTDGGRYISPELAEQIALRMDSRQDELLHQRLSQREYQVLTRLGAGQSITEIGQELHLSAKTVSTYRARVLEKMGLKTNADLIRYVLEHNLPATR